MKRKLICAALTALLLAGGSLTARAEDYDYQEKGWKVEFTGKEMTSNFTSTDLSEAVYALQPGDSVTISLNLENKSGGSSEWYMTNRVIASLEDSSSQARGGAYAYRLTYTGGDGTVTTLFDSAAVGGEKSTTAGLGLHEAAESLDEYFRLDTLSSGAKGKVTLMVALDGETQGNAYQNTLADLRMTFAVDTLNTVADNGSNGGGNGNNGGGNDGNSGDGGNNGGGSSGGGSDGGNGSGGNDGNNGANGSGGGTGNGTHSYTTGGVKTGDSSNLALWSALAFASGAVLLVTALFGMKKDRKEEEA